MNSLKFSRREDCPSCGSHRYRKACAYDKVEAVRCASCGLVFLNPYVTAESMREIYASPEDLAKYFPFCDNYFEDTLHENRNTRTFKIYESCLLEIAEKSKGRALLDVGCGAGQFLQMANAKGWEVLGLDFDNANLKRLAEKNLPVQAADFLKWKGDGKSFDAITMWDAFEHFSKPRDALKQCRRLLKKDGLLLIACPKENSLLAWLARLVYSLSLGHFEYPVKVVYLLDHPVFFSPSSISNILESEGFAVEKIKMDETDLERVQFHPFIKWALRILFLVSRPFKLQNRMIVVARCRS